MSVTMRRCASIAKAINNSALAKRLTSWGVSAFTSGPQEEVHEKRQHAQQDHGGEEFGHAEDAHLRRERHDQREGEAPDSELRREHGQREEEGRVVVGLGESPRKE